MVNQQKSFASQTDSGWSLRAERGPECVFVRISNELTGDRLDQHPQEHLSECILKVMQQHLTRRVVVDVDNVNLSPAEVCDELLYLQRTVAEQGGLVRFVGNSPEVEQEMLSREPSLQMHRSRQAALLGRRAK